MVSLENIIYSIEKLKQAPSHLSEHSKKVYHNAFGKYREVGNMIFKTLEIIQVARVSETLVVSFDPMVAKYLEMQKLMLVLHEPVDNNRVSSIFNHIDTWHKDFFDISSSNKNLMIVNAIANYETHVLEKQRDELFQIQLEYKKHNAELAKKEKLIDDILKKLENPSAEKVLSDYAKIYDDDSKTNDETAGWWLAGAVVLVIVFTGLLILSICYEWFPTVMKLESNVGDKTSSKEIINIPVLLTKAFLISLILYIIVFCFRQYSIFKNLFVVNQQKMNAFNSYRMFEAAIGEGDTESKKALLMSLAKTIHESTNTGFLQGKENQSPSINNIDIGKLQS